MILLRIRYAAFSTAISSSIAPSRIKAGFLRSMSSAPSRGSPSASGLPEQRAAVSQLKSLIAKFEETRDIRLIGGYKQDTDQELDRALRLVPTLYQFISQSPDEVRQEDTIDSMLVRLLGR